MRKIIVAGLIMGVALGIQSVNDSHLEAKANHAAAAARLHVSEPWYIAMNAGSDRVTRSTPAGTVRI